MRERVQLIRVSHPQLGHYEADLMRLEASDHEDGSHYVIFLPMNTQGPSLEVGERVVVRWEQRDNPSQAPLKGRGRVVEVIREGGEGDGVDEHWLTYRLEISLQNHVSNLRHYPRLLGGIRLYYAPVNTIEDADAWLTTGPRSETDLNSDSRFSLPLDELMNFSVSGLSFESEASLDSSSLLLCAVGVGVEEELSWTLGKVVRCQPSELGYSVALHFVSPPQELIEKLSSFTLKLQRVETDGGEYEI